MRERHLRSSLVLTLLFGALPFASIATCAPGGLLAPREAQASVAIAASVEDLARVSSVIARVTALDRESAWEDGRIVTYSRVRVDDVVAGATPAGARELRIRTLGGNVGKIGQTVEGEAMLTVGAPCIVFLAARATPASTSTASAAAASAAAASTVASGSLYVVGRAQGQLLVRRDVHGREIVRVGAVGELVPRPIHPPLRDTGRRILDLDGAPLQAVTTDAKRAWEVSHAR